MEHKQKADELINRFIKYSHRPYDDGFNASYKE